MLEDRIVQISTGLFLARGLRGITMDYIAREAGMSKKTVYKYFSSKEELAEAVLDKLIASMGESFDTTLAELWGRNPVEGLREAGHRMAGIVSSMSQNYLDDLRRYYPDLWNKVVQARKTRYGLFERMLKDAQARGYIRRDINLAVTQRVFETTIEIIMNPGFLLENSLSFSQAMDYLIDILLKGVKANE